MAAYVTQNINCFSPDVQAGHTIGTNAPQYHHTFKLLNEAIKQNTYFNLSLTHPHGSIYNELQTDKTVTPLVIA